MGVFRPIRVGFAVTAGLVVAGVLSAPAAAAAGGTVQGTFTSAEQAAISGAQVVAYSAEDSWLADATTDAAGHYTLRGVTAGGVKLSFDDGGRRQWSPGVRDGADATVYTLAAGGTLTVDERQPALARIAGHFTDDAGAPAPALVTAAGTDGTTFLTASTDEDGAWAIDVFPGQYRINFQWESAKQWAYQNASTVFTAVAGQTVTVDDRRLPTGTVSGRLTAADGSGLADAAVTLYRDAERIGFTNAMPDGTFFLGAALAGDGYTLSYSVGDGPELYVPGTLSAGKARKFAVTAGQDTAVDDQQPAPATVHGRLTGPDGSPKAGYQVGVTLDDNDNWINFDATTAADGTWRADGVYPGDYRVSFVTPDFGRTQYAYGKGSAAEATLIPVTGGASVTVDDTWLPGATLVVTAVDATTGAPVTGFCAVVNSPGDGSACVRSGNQATITDLPAGRFQVQVNPDQSGYYLNSDRVPVTLTAGATTSVTVRLTLGGKIAISAVDRATRAPLADVCGAYAVLGRGGLGDGYGDCTGATGTATTGTKAPGTYEMFAVAPDGYGRQWVGPAGGTGDQRAAARIVVQPGRTVPAPVALIDRPGTITGVVTDAAGAPLAGHDVAYSAWGDAGPGWNTTTDLDGRYTIDVLGPYAWPLLFGGENYPREWSGHEGNRFAATTVRSTYNFTPRRTSTLTGRVRVPGGAGAQWRIHAVNAVTGDQLSVADGVGDAGTYTMALAGAQQVKLDWHVYRGEDETTGWYDHATDITRATPIGIPPRGTRTLNLTLR